MGHGLLKHYCVLEQEIWNERKEYGYHPAFALAALLDPALNSLMDQVDAEDRVAAEALVVKLAGTLQLHHHVSP
jgi:hypothetical protein